MPTQTAPTPDLHLQTGSLYATGDQSTFEVIGPGTGSPVAYSPFTGQFSGPVTSTDLDADPFSDRLRDVAANDQVTFVIAVQNTGAAPAWDVVLRDTPPAGFIVPPGGADLHVTNGAGDDIATTGDLFSPTGGLSLDPSAPLAAYNASSGLNVALVTFTLQATSAIPAPSATLRNAARIVHAAASSGGPDLAGPDLAGPALSGTTELVTMAPTISATLASTSAAATPGNLLALGEAATVHATITLPSGRSTGLRIDAALPAGLSLVSETITYATPGTTALYVGEASTTGFTLGTLSAAAPIRVELDIVARATAASDGAIQAVVSASDPAGTGARVATATGAAILARVPLLSLSIDGPPQVQAGQVASYTLRLTNAAGAATAYDVRLADALGAGLTLVPGSVTASGPAAGALATTGTAGPMAEVAQLDAGESLVLTLQARVESAAPGATLSTTAQATAAALPGGAASQVAPASASATTQVTSTGANRPPAIAGATAGQATTATLAVLPFAALQLSDPDATGQETLTIQAPPNLGTLHGTLGAYDPATRTYTAHGTPDALAADARTLAFTPIVPGAATFAITLDDGAGGIAQDSSTTLQIQPSADTSGVAQHFLQLPAATFLTAANGRFTTLVGEEYHGPVPYLQNQLIYDSADPAVIIANAPNSFVKSLSGFCAIQLAGGRNVVDAGPGSNFITGGDGDDTFFLDATHGAVTWNTIQNFHPGDTMTLFGFHPATSSFTWSDDEGATGYTGRTLHADLAGTGNITTSLTFTGTTAADTDKYVVQTGSLGSLDYLAVTCLR